MSAGQLTTAANEYAQISSTTNVMTINSSVASPGYLAGIFVSAASSTPTITVYDDPSSGTGTKIIDTFTPTAGTFYLLPAKFITGCNVAISGTVSCTVFFNRP